MILTNILSAATDAVSINRIDETLLKNVPIEGITKVVSTVIDFFSFGGLIAIGILIFSLLLKIIPLPLDVYSRASAKKNALKMEKMRPQLERLQKQYANDKQLYNQKMMALYKKEGYSTFSSCLPTLITLIFFIVVITAFNKYSTYTNLNSFNEMAKSYNYSISSSEYIETYEENGKTKFKWNETAEWNNVQVKDLTVEQLEELKKEIKKTAADDAADTYFKVSEGSKFLWVTNIWVADLPWEKSFLSYNNFSKSLRYSNGCFSTKTIETSIDEATYLDITASPKLDEVKQKPNGYLGLVILSIGTMLLSQIVLGKSQKSQMELQSVGGANGQAAQTSKMMMWMMPIMFGIFSFFYSAAFSIYLIISTVFSMISTLIINKIVETKFRAKMEKEEQEKYNQRFKHLRKDK